MVYFNNNIIYLNSKKEYKNTLNGFYKDFIIKKIPIIFKKYEFHITKTNFVEFIIKLK